MKAKPAPACDRCGANPGDHVWAAASRPAGKVFGEFRLCPTCVERLRSFFSNGKNRPAATPKPADPPAISSPTPEDRPAATQKPADPPAPVSPAPKNSRADEVPIRRSS
jgi:hypothetical protein